MSQDVLLLHGLSKDAAMMHPMQRALSQRGYCCYNISYPSTRLTIRGCAEFVLQKLQSLRVGREDKLLHVVGHSMGGLVALTIMTQLNPNLQWGRVVLLGTPLQGSLLVKRLLKFSLYRWYYGQAGCEIADYGLLLPAIKQPLGVIAGTLCDKLGFLVIKWLGRTGHDGRILIAETQVDCMTDFLEFPTTHPQLPKESGVILQVLSFLKTEKFCR